MVTAMESHGKAASRAETVARAPMHPSCAQGSDPLRTTPACGTQRGELEQLPAPPSADLRRPASTGAPCAGWRRAGCLGRAQAAAL
jgi:hypothetical protein